MVAMSCAAVIDPSPFDTGDDLPFARQGCIGVDKCLGLLVDGVDVPCYLLKACPDLAFEQRQSQIFHGS